MRTGTTLLCILLAVAATRGASGQDQPAAEQSQADAIKDIAARLKEKPDDKSLFDRYMIQNLGIVRGMIQADPDQAEKRLAEMKQLIESLEPTTDAGKNLVQRGLRAVDFYGQQVALGRVTLEELADKLREDPNDAKTMSMYWSKLRSEVSPLTRTEPDKAEQLLTSARELRDTIRDRIEEDAARSSLNRLQSLFDSLEKRIETGKRLAALVGMDAAPLDVETWVNGEPLTEQDLKGKVVLLDFWAVWCGPCVATFPHLREWHETYADKGLVIIGLTRYYNYVWDNEAGRPKRAPGGEEVTPEQELQMLEKFAEHHNLHHRFAIQKDRTLSDYYAVSGIPHVVLIDRQGTIRLIRIGSGEQNAKDISEMIAKLID